MIANDDPELFDWLGAIIEGKPVKSGDFLRCLAETAFRADYWNYEILRPALLQIKQKYPQYSREVADG